MGETLIQLLISDDNMWSDSKCIDIIKALVTTKRWDPNSSSNPEGDTVLHLSVKHHKPEVTNFLPFVAKCDPNVRNEMGETLIQLLISDDNMWSDSECIDIIKALVTTKRWDPNSSSNPKGDTVLHLSIKYHRPRILQYLLSETKCDPN